MTPRDDRHQSTAANVVDVIVGGIQIVFEGAGLVIEGLVSLLTVLG